MISDEKRKIIDAIKESDLNEYDNLSNLLVMAKSVLADGEENLQYCLKISNFVKKKAQQLVFAKEDVQFDELYWESLRFEAYYLFDSYLLYVEKDREPSEKFYQPRRKKLIKHGMIQALQDLEDGVIELLSVSVPPGCGKTTLEEFFASWIIGRHPEKYNLFSSHSGDITRMLYDAIDDITATKTKDQEQVLEYRWHDIFPNVYRQSENAKMQTINFGKFKPFKTIQCRSIDSKNAGVVRCNGYLVCDDLIGGIEEAISKPRLDKLWTKYSVDLRQRKKDGCKELHVATRWSVHDVIGRLKVINHENNKARFIAIPDINPETGESNFDYDYGVGFTVEYFEDMKNTMDDVSYKCLFKSEPIEREGLLYHEDELRRYLTLPVEEPDAIIGICDTKDKGTDFMFLPCCYQYGDDFYYVDCVCDDNTDYGVQYKRCSDLIVRNNMQQCEFESNNGGSRVGFEVNKLVEEQGGRCNITTKFTTGNKETKIIVNADWVKKHVIFKDKSLYKPKEDYGISMAWLLAYTTAGKNAHDDVPDGWAQFALYTGSSVRAKCTAMKRPF